MSTPHPRSKWSTLIVATLLLWSAGCGTLRDDLREAEVHYDAARYENAVVWLELIEQDIGDLAGRDRARAYYMRGMAALRLERRDEALHYLSLARREFSEAGGGLRDSWSETLAPTLEELTPQTATHHAAMPVEH